MESRSQAGQPYIHPEANTKLVGSVPVTVQASELGYAGASLQFDTLPVGNNFSPRLGLSYSSSQFEDSLAGTGWNLSGLSTISRCPSQKVFEGVDRTIDWSDADAYCYDGKKLLLVKGQAGNDGAEYRLYLDDQKKIVRINDHFEVLTRSGERLVFGHSAQNRVIGPTGTVFSYHLDKILDSSGNSIEISYENDGNHLFASRVLYGGNDIFLKPHYREITFHYEISSSPVKRYIAGLKMEAGRILKEVKIGNVGGGTMFSYRLHHEAQGQAGQNILVAVDQCFKDLKCIPKTSFDYDVTKDIQLNEENAYIWTDYAPLKNLAWAPDKSARTFVDLNNDGYIDLLALRKDTISYSLAGPGGPGPAIDQTRTDLAKWSPLVDMFSVSDMNRDGFNDIVLFTQNGTNPGVYVGYWNGNGFDELVQMSTQFGVNWSIRNNIRAVVDVNNDGWPDVIGSSIQGIFVAFNDKSGKLVGGEQPLAKYFTYNDGFRDRNNPRYFVDINGDGLVDVAGFGDKEVFISLGTGTGFSPPTTWSNQFPNSKYNPNTMIRQFADVNGDGLLDIVGMGAEGVDVALNTGTSFSSSERWLNNLGWNQGWDFTQRDRFILDVNKDGYADFIGFRNTTGVEIYLGSGRPNIDQKPIKTKPFGPLMLVWDSKNNPIQLDDLDANGKMDLFTSLNKGLWKSEFNGTSVKLKGVRTSLGEETRITYKTLIDPSVYRQTKSKVKDLIPIVGGLDVVAEVKKSNGIGGYFSTRYSYENAFSHRDIFGFLGFEKRRVFDDVSGTETLESYSQDVAKMTMGAMISNEVYSTKNGRVLVSSSKTEFEVKQLGVHPLRRAVLEKSNESRFFDEKGQLSYSVSVDKKYDDFQNAVLVETSITDGYGTYKTRTDSKFDNDPVNWKIGLVEEVKTTASSTTSTDVSVKKTVFEYDNDGRLASETMEPDSTLWVKKQYVRTHNSFGLVDTVISSWSADQGKGLAFSSTTDTIEYDGQGFIQKSINALGHASTRSVFADTGLPRTVVDPNGLVTTYAYDEANRIKSVKRLDERLTVVERRLCDSSCPANAVLMETTSTQGFGSKTVYMDALGRSIRIISSLFGQKSVAEDAIYGENGLLIRSSKPYFSDETPKHWINYAYDERNRKKLVAFPDGSSQELRYEGLRTIVKDALGRSTIYDKDARGLLVAVTNPKTEILKYTYDSAGNPASITDDGGNQTFMTYDLFGRRVSISDPTTGLSTTDPNVFGLAASQSNQGVTTTGKFDALGRILEKTVTMAGVPDRVERYTYDETSFGIGQLSKATGPDSTVSYTYDKLSRPVETVRNLLGKPYTSSTEYDASGRVSRQTYPSGFAIDYIYDEVSQLAEVRNRLSGKTLWALGKLHPNGDIKEYRLGNGAKGFKSIDERNDRLLSESIAGVDQALQIARSYEHDAVGNLLSRKDNVSGVTESFGYDALNRLESFPGAGLKPVTMKYDNLSRITQRSDVGVYQYGAGCAGAPSSPFILKKVGDKNYCADTRGNMIQSGNRSVKYDANNLPTEIREGDKLVRYRYGFANSMLSKEETIAGEKTLTRYVGESFEIEESSLGTKQRHYVGDFLVVETEGSDFREHYLYKDFLGSTLAAADQTGAIIERMAYDPFGQRRSVQDLSWLNGFKPKTTSHGFTGHDHAESMNLIHMKGRMYDPAIGLFLSADPYVQDPTLVQNLNRYSYVINNPLSYTDPSGHFFKHAFREIGRGLTSAGRALQNPGKFIENTWNKLSKGASDPRYHRLAASVAISVVATIWQPQWAAASWQQSAAYYAAVGYTTTYVATNGDKKAALNGAITAAAFNMVGSYFDTVKMDTGMRMAKIAAHGTVGGLASVANGGRFESGFLSSGLSELAGQNNLYGSAKGNGWQIASGAARAAIVGGTVSELSGGSFESGALNAAMGRLFNGVAHASPVATALEDIGMAIRGFVTGSAEWATAAGRAGAVGVVAWAALHSDEIGDGDTIQPTHPVPKFEDFWDPTKPPEGDWVWRGKPGVEPGTGPGNWVQPNPDGGRPSQTLNPDLDHPEGIKPHWDWTDPAGKKWRVFEGGLALPK
jgi:RHS repeat-associated protein